MGEKITSSTDTFEKLSIVSNGLQTFLYRCTAAGFADVY
jgi:hypothetical protein